MIQERPRPVRHMLGAEELVELGRAVPMYRYAHTPFLAGRSQLGRVNVAGNLFQPAENLFEKPVLSQAVPSAPVAAPAPAPAAQSGFDVKTALMVGIPMVGAALVLFVSTRG